MWILDTDVCIELLRGRSPRAADRLASTNTSGIGVTTISVAELSFGAMKSDDPSEMVEVLQTFLSPFEIHDFSLAAAARYGEIRADLARRGARIGPLDMLIAAIVLERDETLVTNNTREFGRVRGLRIENWMD